MKINYLMTCDSVIVEKGSDKLSIIGIFENISAQTFPAMHPVFCLVGNAEHKNPGEYELEVIFYDEKEEITKLTSKVTIGNNLQGNFIKRIVSYQIPREQRQKIKVLYEGKIIHESSITVNGI